MKKVIYYDSEKCYLSDYHDSEKCYLSDYHDSEKYITTITILHSTILSMLLLQCVRNKICRMPQVRVALYIRHADSNSTPSGSIMLMVLLKYAYILRSLHIRLVQSKNDIKCLDFQTVK